jgi:protein-S-isoprenylcysteine O-methyltransferase Ste14
MALQEELKKQGDFLFKYRSFLPLIILGVGMAVFVISVLDRTEVPDTWISRAYPFICLAASLLGLLVRIVTVGYAPKNTSGRNTKTGQLAEELNTSGIYSTVRHPLYLGNFFMWLGVAMLTQNTWFIIAFILFYAFYYERIMYAEEAFLRNKFGQVYLDWSEYTPAIIPSFGNFVKAKYPFSIKKVLKKEKNGLWAVFLLFWIFDMVASMVSDGIVLPEPTFWLYGAAITTFLYLLIKFLDKRKLLSETNR